MAIEDHPKFPEWSKALDRLTKTRDEYACAKAFATGEALSELGDLQALEAEIWEAMRSYDKISDEIDA
jgi:hypothetical protein